MLNFISSNVSYPKQTAEHIIIVLKTDRDNIFVERLHKGEYVCLVNAMSDSTNEEGG